MPHPRWYGAPHQCIVWHRLQHARQLSPTPILLSATGNCYAPPDQPRHPILGLARWQCTRSITSASRWAALKACGTGQHSDGQVRSACLEARELAEEVAGHWDLTERMAAAAGWRCRRPARPLTSAARGDAPGRLIARRAGDRSPVTETASDQPPLVRPGPSESPSWAPPAHSAVSVGPHTSPCTGRKSNGCGEE